jgi:ABC-type spermidine/putrescine transport system permease subunit I
MAPTTTAAATDPQTGGPSQAAARFLYRHPRVRLAGLLTAPLLWLVVLYLGSLAIMVVASFWSVDSFTGTLVRESTTSRSSSATRSTPWSPCARWASRSR